VNRLYKRSHRKRVLAHFVALNEIIKITTAVTTTTTTTTTTTILFLSISIYVAQQQ
jgi:hypothetical protein